MLPPAALYALVALQPVLQRRAVLMPDMVREAWEDQSQHKADQEVNGRTVQVCVCVRFRVRVCERVCVCDVMYARTHT